jgi:hypothetical protein
VEEIRTENWYTRDTSQCISCKIKVLVTMQISAVIMSRDICIFCSPECTMKWARGVMAEADAEWAELEEEHRLLENLPECPGEECLACTGEACRLCGAGCWAPPSSVRSVKCDHDVIDRHQRPKGD